MSTNILPILSNSLIVFKEAIKNVSKLNSPNSIEGENSTIPIQHKELPEILFITSYPPRECGIATYTQDLRSAIM